MIKFRIIVGESLENHLKLPLFYLKRVHTAAKWRGMYLGRAHISINNQVNQRKKTLK